MMAVLALAAAFLLAWHGMAKAVTYVPQFQAIPVPPAHAADAHAPAKDDDNVTGAACTDTMDMTPESAASSPFDADRVAFHGKAYGLNIPAWPVSANICQ